MFSFYFLLFYGMVVALIFRLQSYKFFATWHKNNSKPHDNNVFKEGELDRENNVLFLHVIGVKKPVPTSSTRTTRKKTLFGVGHRQGDAFLREVEHIKYGGLGASVLAVVHRTHHLNNGLALMHYLCRSILGYYGKLALH